MNLFEDPYAEWKFSGYHTPIDHETFNEFSLSEKRKFIISRIFNLKEILRSLNSYDLLKVDHFYINDVVIGLDDSTDSIGNIIKIINEQNIRSWSFSMTGKTSLSQMDRIVVTNGIIGFLYEPIFDLVTIETYSDIWQPIDTFGESLNVTDALINSNRLENCLKKIKKNGLFEKIDPDEGEESNEAALQYGFRMYHKKSIFKEFYPALKLEVVEPFVWEKRKNRTLLA